MKKLLSLLGAIGLTATTGATVVACGQTSTKKSVDNDVVTKQNYQVATQNIVPENFADGDIPDADLITKFEEHLRGYLNPLFLNLIGQNNVNINDDYNIEGVTAETIKNGIEAIKNGAEDFQFGGITVVAKDNAQYLSGEVVLPTLTIMEGIDFTSLINTAKSIIVKCEDYLPNFEEVIKHLNDAIKDNTGELDVLKLGHFTFQINQNKLIITGNGLYYGSIIVGLESNKAVDINTKINPVNDNDYLGNLGFIKKPTIDQLFNVLTEKYGPEYNESNLLVVSHTDEKAEILGHNELKGIASVRYDHDVFDLNQIINKNLGALDNPPKNKQELIKSINAVNQGLDLTEDLITIAGKISDSNVYIAAREESKIVSGVAEITWSNKQYDLSELIKNQDLGALVANASEETILEKINKLNNTTLVLKKDVEIKDIQDIENGGRIATLSAVENHSRYRGSVKINWIKITELNTKNIERAIKDLKDRLVFSVKVGSSVEAAKKEVSEQIKDLLSEKYAIPEKFAIEYSVFPDEEFMKKPTPKNQPWFADEADMIFTLDDKSDPVAIAISWRINVVA